MRRQASRAFEQGPRENVLDIEEAVTGDDQVTSGKGAGSGVPARGNKDVRSSGEESANGGRRGVRGRCQNFNRVTVNETCEASGVREIGHGVTGAPTLETFVDLCKEDVKKSDNAGSLAMLLNSGGGSMYDLYAPRVCWSRARFRHDQSNETEPTLIPKPGAVREWP